MAVLLNASASGRRLCRVGGQDTCLIGTVSLSVPPRRPEGQGNTRGQMSPMSPCPLVLSAVDNSKKPGDQVPLLGKADR